MPVVDLRNADQRRAKQYRPYARIFIPRQGLTKRYVALCTFFASAYVTDFQPAELGEDFRRRVIAWHVQRQLERCLLVMRSPS